MKLHEYPIGYARSGVAIEGMWFRLLPLVLHLHEKSCVLHVTPRASGRDSGRRNNKPTYISGRRNPEHTEWLMGLPGGWTEVAL